MTEYEAVILDVDGTILRGDELLPDTPAGFRALEAAGCERLLFSNNPTRDGTHYREKLAPHGIDVDPESVLTSASVSAAYLSATHSGEPVFLVGEDRLEAILEAAGVDLTDDPAAAEVVLGSVTTEFSYSMLRDALRALEGDVPFYGTDPDTTIPVDDGRIPGSGAILAAMEAVADREPDAILGKPSSVAAETAIDRLEAPPDRTLVVGDRLNTDIALGNRAGMDTAVVLTGIADRDSIAASSVDPDYVLDSLGDLERVLE
ncbi:HAD-IIA family hydrolase [Halopiger goleimassiliensis]|uniref:HAD-IIA family hydrolase n=1 Tax=Halopiger goleimassiliensis TaxID=1293048 RepID=UPI000677BC84|nr:HAD-IIA family hydrolase [Halopiger goleimassiliensis]